MVSLEEEVFWCLSTVLKLTFWHSQWAKRLKGRKNGLRIQWLNQWKKKLNPIEKWKYPLFIKIAPENLVLKNGACHRPETSTSPSAWAFRQAQGPEFNRGARVESSVESLRPRVRHRTGQNGAECQLRREITLGLQQGLGRNRDGISEEPSHLPDYKMVSPFYPWNYYK